MGAGDLLAGNYRQDERLLRVSFGGAAEDVTLVPLRAQGITRLGRQFEWSVDAVSSDPDVALKQLIAQDVTLWLQQADGSYRAQHGYVHTARRLGSDAGQTHYQFGFASWLHFLRFRKDARIWQDRTVDAILGDVFEMHPQARGAYRFELSRALPTRSFCVQYEDDWNFCHRLMESEGLFCWFEQADDGKAHTVVITDDLYGCAPMSPPTIAFDRSGTARESGGLLQWAGSRALQSASYTARTFDYKSPDTDKTSSRPTIGNQGELPAQTEVYEYTGAYTYDDSQRGEHLNQLRLQEWESRAKRFHGVGGARQVAVGRWFELTSHPVHGLESSEDREFAVIEASWSIENNLPIGEAQRDFPHSLKTSIAARRAQVGMDENTAHAGEGFFLVEIEAQRRRIPYRSPFAHHKPSMPMQTATVVGPANEEVYTDELNRVKVRMHWDRLNAGDENASCWVRVAYPHAGGGWGGVFVPRVGEEVIIDYLDGDLDRPIITGRVYNGANTPQWHSNGLLSGQKSKEFLGSGYNQLVFDDSTGQGRVHLYSTQTSARLDLGYLIQQDGNARGAYRGSGFELASQAYGAIHAAQGLLLSTHGKPEGSQQLDVSETREQLRGAQSLVQTMSEASAAHQAETLEAAQQALKTLYEATQKSVAGVAEGGRTAGGGAGNANGFQEPVMVLSAPAGMGLSTQDSLHVAADQQLNVVSGQSTHIAAGKSLLASVSEKISLFVPNAGMKLFAGKGKVEIQAHSDNIELTAQKSVKLISATERIEVAADQEILLTSGGAYIRLKGGNIEIHAPGAIDVKGSQHAFAGPVSMPYKLPIMPQSICIECLMKRATTRAPLVNLGG